jgi:hypothetical protein
VKTVDALDCATTVIGLSNYLTRNFLYIKMLFLCGFSSRTQVERDVFRMKKKKNYSI